MADITQKFIDDLITLIWDAEDAESVTNEMVARVFDYLNRGYKDLLTIRPDLETETAQRQAADCALQQTIDALQYTLQAVSQRVESAEDTLDLILGNNASVAIDNFNEIISFLEGVKDSDSLVNLLDEIRERLAAIEARPKQVFLDPEDYEALGEKDPDTVYFIYEDE